MTEKIIKKYRNNKYSVLRDDDDLEIICYDDFIYYNNINKNFFDNEKINNLEKDIKNLNINNKSNDKSSILGKRKFEDFNNPCKSRSIGCGIYD
jgi:hypothetical protein